MKYISSRKKDLPSKVLLSALSFTGSVLTSTAVWAEETTAHHQLETIKTQATPNPSYYSKVSNNNKITTALLDTPRTVNIISKQELEDRNVSSLQEVLRTTPGITLGSGEGGTPIGDRPFIRGYEASTDILVDGMRDYARGSHEIFNIESVEVSKDPGSIYSGRGSTGGTINLITKKPKAKTASEVTSEYQTSGQGQTKTRFTTDNNVAFSEHIAMRLNAMLDRGELAYRDQVEVDRWGIAPSITFGLNTPTRFTASYSRLQFNDKPDMGVPFSNARNPNRTTPIETQSMQTNFGRPNIDFREYQSTSIDLNFEHDFSDDLKLRFAARDLETSQDYLFTRVSFGCANSSGIACVTEGQGLTYNRANRPLYRTSHANTLQLTLQNKFKTGALQHDLLMGVDYSKERIANKDMTILGAGTETVNFYAPTYRDYPNFAIQYGAEKKAGEIEATGLYFLDTVQLLPRLDVNLGLRFDDYSSTNMVNKVKENMWNYQLGVIYKIAPKGRLYVNYATSSNPSGENLGQAGGADGVASGNRFADNVKAERTRSIEAGTKWEVLNDQLSLNLAVFETEKTNARAVDIDGLVTVNGKNRVRGTELSAVGQVTPLWYITAGYTYLDSELVDNGYDRGVPRPERGNRMKFIAKHSANLWTTYQVQDKLRVGGGITYVGRRFVDDINKYELPSHVRYDAFASYQIMPEFEVQLNINNLTNERVYDASHVGVFSTVAPGRSFGLKGSYRF